MNKYKKPWKQNVSTQPEVNDIVLLAKSILNCKNKNKKYTKELLSILIWKITEIHGKYNTRYISEGVYEMKTENKLPIHEHVIERKKIIEKILKKPKDVEKELKKAIACLVTQKENKLLSNKYDGWNRYKKAKIKVYDRLNKNWIIK